MSKLSFVVLNLIGLIIQQISSLYIPQEQFGPERQTGIFDPLGPLQEIGFKSLPKNLKTEGCWPKKLCHSQQDCGTDGICYISSQDPNLGEIRFLSVYFCVYHTMFILLFY